jgi:hypothetical protein
MKTGRPEYYLPSASTVSRDVKEVFKKVRGRIATMLQVGINDSPFTRRIRLTYFIQEHEGTLSFGTDAWTSPNHKAYVAVTVHFEHNGEPMCLLLDLVEVAKSHSGINLASAFAKILTDFGISHKVSLLYHLQKRSLTLLDQILSVTCDNASPNDVMIDALAELIVAFPGAANRTRCFTHILNLVVKAILHQFDVPKGKEGETLDVASQALVDLAGDIEMEEAAMDEGGDDDETDGDEGWIDPLAGMSKVEREELDVSVRPVRLVLVKVSSNSDSRLYS